MPVDGSDNLLLNEALDLITCTTIFGTFFGIVLVLYCLCGRLLYLRLQLREPGEQSQAGFTLGLISFLLLCTTTIVVLNTGMIELAYIKHPDYPGGPIGYEYSYGPTINMYFTTGGILNMMIEVATMAVQIWRLWVIWSGMRFAVAITIIPSLLLLTYIALVIPTEIVPSLVPIDRMGISFEIMAAMEIASFAILSSITILVTGLIIGRLLFVRRSHTKMMSTSNISNPYMSIIAMLIESYALDSVWSIASAISRGLESPSLILFISCDPIIKVIAYFLVVYRVTSGRGWTKETGHKLTTLEWNHEETSTYEVGSVHFQVPAMTTTTGEMGSQHVPYSEPAV